MTPRFAKSNFKLSLENLVKVLIVWLVFNTSINSVSAISWRELQELGNKTYFGMKQSGYMYK